jgi:hypothetical protein
MKLSVSLFALAAASNVHPGMTLDTIEGTAQNGLRGLGIDSLGDESGTKHGGRRAVEACPGGVATTTITMDNFLTTATTSLWCLIAAMQYAADIDISPPKGAGGQGDFAGDLADKTFLPGIYDTAAAISLTGDVTLSGGPDAVWVFRTGGAFTTAASSKVILTGGALSKNVFWKIVGAVTVGVGGSTMEGAIMASGAITLGAGATTGPLLSSGGAITLGAGPTSGALVAYGAISLGADARAQSVTTTAAITLGAGASAESDFLYPKDMPRPPYMWVEGFAARIHAGPVQKYETPIQVWQSWRLDQAMWNCIAAYHPTALDALTKERPHYVAPEAYHTSEARALCMLFAVNKIIPDLVPSAAMSISGWLEDLGLDSTILTDEDARGQALAQISPRVLGSVVAANILDDMKSDGWNYDGRLVAEDKECTANCRPFTDTTGYTPKNSPWKVTNPVKWQPLIESDGNGFFYAQEHVTPHIGTKVTPVILTQEEFDNRILKDPNYDYDDEAVEAVKKVKELRTSPYWRDMVRFMDNKSNISGGMIKRLREKYDLSLESQVFYHYGYTSAEIDVVILAWKEKVHWDLIRPTSVVQALGDTEVDSFAGLKHAARDWVPYIRVMPHSEYPSGSGCLCQAVSQYIDAFLNGVYGHKSIATTWTFEEMGELTFDTMDDLKDVCGTSRLMGGMHFTKSVTASYDLCDGVGTLAYSRLMLPLIGGVGNYLELNDGDKEKPSLGN